MCSTSCQRSGQYQGNLTMVLITLTEMAHVKCFNLHISLGYQPVFASVTMHWISFLHNYPTQFVRIQDASFASMTYMYLMEFLKVLCWVLCYIHCIYPHWVTLRDLMACLIVFMRMIGSYICPFKHNLLRICQFVNLQMYYWRLH